MHDKEAAIRVTLIDDHPTMLWGLEKLIEAAAPHMKVVSAVKTGAEALKQVDLLTPDLIVLDLDLDGKSSIDLIQGLTKNGKSRVLIFTGSTDQQMLDLAVRCGARGVLHKGAALGDVIKAIQKVHQGELWLDQAMLNRVLVHLRNPAPQHADPEAERQARLTSRERRVIQAVVEGNGALNKTIAQKLCISEHTLRNHLTSIYHKLAVANRLELYVYAVKHRLGTNGANVDIGA